MGNVIVIGGGPAGMMAAYAAAYNGQSVLLLEKNEKLGKKLYITGKGRCNLTNRVAPTEFLENVVTNAKFVTGSIYRFSSEDTVRFFETNGLALKTERGDRVFPKSDKASDVTKCLASACSSVGVRIQVNTPVAGVRKKDSRWLVVTESGNYEGDSVIICTGGVSYPSTGSTGDGYRFATEYGHFVVEPKPALSGIEVRGSDCAKLQGLSLKNVRLDAFRGEKRLFSEQGEMLFTHYGVSGPIVLSLSSYINRIPMREIKLSLDLKPALTDAVLDARILRDFSQLKGKQMKNSLDLLLPKSLIPVVLLRSGVLEIKTNCELTAEERRRLVREIKNFVLLPSAIRPIEEAIVTAGGVRVDQINPKTMESKLHDGLFFAGEVLDIDALTGGFNIQLALSTGYTAGMNA